MSAGSGLDGIGRVGVLALALGLAWPAGLGAQQVPASPPPDASAPAQGAPADTAPIRIPAIPSLPPAPDNPQTALDQIESSISLSNERVEALKREIEEMSGDRARQNAALIAAGQRVKLAEIEVADMEERLGNLIAEELDVRGRLESADTDIANMLAALERVGRNPPPALIVNPTDALGSARSAILMSAILPQLRDKADAVTADLKKLTEIKAAAVEEERQLKANFAVLEEEQLRIATLLAARNQGMQIKSAELAREEQEAAALAARATTLKDLVGALSDQATAMAAARSSAGLPSTTDPAARAEAIRTALANTSRTQPAMPFHEAKGWLTMPAGGTRMVEFGAGDGFGGISEGLSVATRPEAQVVAPADGWVMYKGPYLNYGQIVILNPGDDYTILLAGLNAISVNIGQFVLMGEPLGTMGSHTIGASVATNAGAARPTLYIEMRQNNEPIDPSGWWADTRTTDNATPNNPTQSG